MKKLLLLTSLLLFGFSVLTAQNIVVYGMAGGGSLDGVLFDYLPSSNVYNVLVDFTGNNGLSPFRNNLIIDTNRNCLYGFTINGGENNLGILFKYDLSTAQETVLLSVDSIGGNAPSGTPLLASNGIIYGMTEKGGTYNDGLLFSYNPSTGIDSVLVIFNDTNGKQPLWGSLIQAKNGLLYGMIAGGGSNGDGVLFSYNIYTKKDSVLFNFNGANGMLPYGSVIQASNGFIYGLTFLGGRYNNDGVLFSFNPSNGKDSILVNLHDTTSTNPLGSLFQASNGKLYGLGADGGGNGTDVFWYDTLTGKDSSSHISFTNSPAGAASGQLIQDNNSGLLYGLLTGYGIFNYGSLFSFDPITLKDSLLFSFNDTDGSLPTGYLVIAKEITLGSKQLQVKSVGLKVYPNPSNGIFTIQLTGTQNSMSSIVEIYNVMGEKVYDAMPKPVRTGQPGGQVQHDYEIDISSQPDGIYLYRVLSGSGGLVGEGKLIIQK